MSAQLQDDYTGEALLCGEDGRVQAALGMYRCTGSSHPAPGIHIRCTNEIHRIPPPNPYTEQRRKEANACVRVAREIREHFKGDPGVPQDFWDDLDTIEEVGRKIATRHLVITNATTTSKGVSTR